MQHRHVEKSSGQPHAKGRCGEQKEVLLRCVKQEKECIAHILHTKNEHAIEASSNQIDRFFSSLTCFYLALFVCVFFRLQVRDDNVV